VKQVCKLKPQRTHLHARAQKKSVIFILNCLQATLITGTIMMFPASCLDRSAWECNLKRLSKNNPYCLRWTASLQHRCFYKAVLPK